MAFRLKEKKLPRTMMRRVFCSCFMETMKGASVLSNLGDTKSGGGTMRVTFFLRGRFSSSFHCDTSGNWSCNTLIVFLVAVAVIINSLPTSPLSSPVDKAMAGLNAGLFFLFSPQSTTKEYKLSIIRHSFCFLIRTWGSECQKAKVVFKNIHYAEFFLEK